MTRARPTGLTKDAGWQVGVSRMREHWHTVADRLTLDLETD